jgi:hypothetical protein
METEIMDTWVTEWALDSDPEVAAAAAVRENGGSGRSEVRASDTSGVDFTKQFRPKFADQK